MAASPIVLAHAVMARRDELGLSVEDAAARANISGGAWRMIEQGANIPSLLMLGAVCRALDWTSDTIEELLRGEPSHDDETVVDLNEEPVAEPEPEPEDHELPVVLDTQGLSRHQLAEVQEHIDDLRGFSRPYD